MTTRPLSPPGRSAPTVTDAQRAAITAALGELPDDLLHAIRDARGHAFQRLEFLGDAVLELVVRFHAVIADGSCAGCSGDADSLVTDAALGQAAKSAQLGDWLEWEPSHERLADLVEACSGAVWLAGGWTALAAFTDRVVHPLAPLSVESVTAGWPGALPAGAAHRTREVLGASVLEVAAAHAAFAASDADEGLLTAERNRLYATHRVVDHALAAGWLTPPVAGDHHSQAAARDLVERRLADVALSSGLGAAVTAAAALLG